MVQTLKAKLQARNACKEGIAWLDDRELSQAWQECPRADWMIWYVAPLIARQDLVILACSCARTALKFIPDGEKRPLAAIETAEKWANGKATIKEVQDAADAVDAPVDAVYTDVEAAAAAAANAAAAAAAAIYAADAAVYAVYAANANAPIYAAAHKTMCNLIRAKLPVPPSPSGEL